MRDQIRATSTKYRLRWGASAAVLGCICIVVGLATTAAASPSAGSLTAKDIAVAHAYVGGSLGKASSRLSPIKVGFVANDTGPTAQPYLATATQNAVSLITDRLGGIAGHRIQLVSCHFGGTAQQGQNCGQQFANDPSIKMVLFPGGLTGGPEMHAANAGKKVYLCTIASPTDAAVANTFCTAGGAVAVGAIASYLKDYLHAQKVTIDTLDDPTLAAIAENQKTQYAKLGMTVTVGLSSPGATDVTSTMVASGAQSADATLITLPLSIACPAYAKAISSLKIKHVVSLATCSDPSVAAVVGETPKLTYFDYGPSVHLADKSGQVSLFLDTGKTYTKAIGQNATQTFGTTLLMAKIMNELGPSKLTTANIAAKINAFKGPAFLGDPKLAFGVAPSTSVGSLRARFFTYTGGGRWKDATAGKWLSAPAG